MPAPTFRPGLAFLTSLGSAPLRPLHTLVRQTEERFRPRQLTLHAAVVTGRAPADPGPRATILRERGTGRTPTIVLGGFVPDATEQVFLLRRFLLKAGDVYYFQYPRDEFSLDGLCAQLDALVNELAGHGTTPVVFAVSFGAGLVLEWLRRARLRGAEPAVSGVLLVSPVSCVADLLGGKAKPATLLGRALAPYFDPQRAATDAAVEKSRTIFVRMFEAGAQNKAALRTLMTRDEVERLRTAVLATIRGITSPGAQRRVQALAAMTPPTAYFSPTLLPLSTAPALILFAEREDLVLDAAAPVRLALQRAATAYFPDAAVREVIARSADAPVQHASLIFHAFEFLPHLQAFYQRVRRGPLPLAA